MRTDNPFSLGALVRRYWRRTALTWGLVLLEALALVAFPVVIGWAVDGLLNDNWSGVFKLGGLCLVLLLAGAARRFYDTRTYAHIYRTVADEVVEEERRKQSPLSAVSGRVSLFGELISFLEESIPSLLNEFIGLFGTLALIATIDVRVFFACLGAAGVTVAVYWLSEAKIFKLNSGLNDEIEQRVAVLESGDRAVVRRHFGLLTRWQIRMSDLETVNYSIIWLALSGVVVYTVVTVAVSGTATMGEVIAAVMYVFGFVEAALVFPLHYAQLIRLREISSRLSQSDEGR
ncbi:MAG: ABC transporter six-transmembrane domain-containing protein [Phycisphaerales bacterium JB043]